MADALQSMDTVIQGENHRVCHGALGRGHWEHRDSSGQATIILRHTVVQLTGTTVPVFILGSTLDIATTVLYQINNKYWSTRVAVRPRQRRDVALGGDHMQTNYDFSTWSLCMSLLVVLQYCRWSMVLWCVIVLEYWNSLGPFYTTIGIAVVTHKSEYWSTVQFMRRKE
jgi:hypothetical protein